MKNSYTAWGIEDRKGALMQFAVFSSKSDAIDHLLREPSFVNDKINRRKAWDYCKKLGWKVVRVTVSKTTPATVTGNERN